MPASHSENSGQGASPTAGRFGVFLRFAVYERWICVPTRNDWRGPQGLLRMAAAILVTILGAAEIRQHLKTAGPNRVGGVTRWRR